MFPTTVEHPYAPRGRRRGRNDPNSRDFICPCGKSYLSYPALFTHIKIKHNGRAPEPKAHLEEGDPDKYFPSQTQKQVYDSESDTDDMASNCIDRFCDFVTNFEKPTDQRLLAHFKQLYTQDSFYRIYLNYNPQQQQSRYIQSHDLYDETCDNVFCQVLTQVNKRLNEPYYIDTVMFFFVMFSRCINESVQGIEKHDFGMAQEAQQEQDVDATGTAGVGLSGEIKYTRHGGHGNHGQSGSRQKRKYDMTNRKKKMQTVQEYQEELMMRRLANENSKNNGKSSNQNEGEGEGEVEGEEEEEEYEQQYVEEDEDVDMDENVQKQKELSPYDDGQKNQNASSNNQHENSQGQGQVQEKRQKQPQHQQQLQYQQQQLLNQQQQQELIKSMQQKQQRRHQHHQKKQGDNDQNYDPAAEGQLSQDQQRDHNHNNLQEQQSQHINRQLHPEDTVYQRVKQQPIRNIVNFINVLMMTHFPKYYVQYDLNQFEIFTQQNMKKFVQHFLHWLTMKKYLPYKVRINDGSSRQNTSGNKQGEGLKLINEQNDQNRGNDIDDDDDDERQDDDEQSEEYNDEERQDEEYHSSESDERFNKENKNQYQHQHHQKVQIQRQKKQQKQISQKIMTGKMNMQQDDYQQE